MVQCDEVMSRFRVGWFVVRQCCRSFNHSCEEDEMTLLKKSLELLLKYDGSSSFGESATEGVKFVQIRIIIISLRSSR